MINNFLVKYRLFFLVVLLLAYCFLITVMSSIYQPYYIKINHLDKLFHFSAYALLSGILFSFFVYQDKISFLKTYPVLCTFLFATSFGIMNELLQIFIPYRTFNKLDIIANMLGVLVAILTMKFWISVIKIPRLEKDSFVNLIRSFIS